VSETEAYYKSPLGWLGIYGDEKAIHQIKFLDDPELIEGNELPDVIEKCIEQLDEYFAKERKEFDLPLRIEGSDFQREVMRLVGNIPWGRTKSYGDLALQLGDSNSSRAIGNANGRNKLPIIIPCHRVIGSDGSLTGYSGGMSKKKWLLSFEGSIKQIDLF